MSASLYQTLPFNDSSFFKKCTQLFQQLFSLMFQVTAQIQGRKTHTDFEALSPYHIQCLLTWPKNTVVQFLVSLPGTHQSRYNLPSRSHFYHKQCNAADESFLASYQDNQNHKEIFFLVGYYGNGTSKLIQDQILLQRRRKDFVNSLLSTPLIID